MAKRCAKHASRKAFLATVVILEGGALVLTGTLWVMNPASTWDPLTTVVATAPSALALGTMVGLYKHFACG